MDTQTIINCVIISLGAIVMLASIINSRHFAKMLHVIPQLHRSNMQLFLTIYQALMVFFLLGYIGALVAIFMGYPLLSESFVSLLFLFGATFVFLSVYVQIRLLRELEDKAP